MNSQFIRRTLLADAVISGAAGVLMVFGASLLAPLTNLPQPLLQIAGITLFPWFLVLLWMSRAESVPRDGVRFVVAINLIWVAGSIAALLLTNPSAFGYAFVIAQAVAVGVFAELQIIALKREPARA